MMLDAMAQDPYAIGYAGELYRNPDVKALALASDPSGPFVELTPESVVRHTYPLIRMISLFLNRPPGTPTDPKLREFLRYVLSREGQQAVQREGRGYLPMLAGFARTELQRIEE
jgi:phosphate transport system substrate-binding protein